MIDRPIGEIDFRHGNGKIADGAEEEEEEEEVEGVEDAEVTGMEEDGEIHHLEGISTAEMPRLQPDATNGETTDATKGTRTDDEMWMTPHPSLDATKNPLGTVTRRFEFSNMEQ